MAGLKICGVTRARDLVACRDLGVDAVGVNLWLGSRRGLSLAQARAMLAEAGPLGAVCKVGVFVDAGVDEVARARRELGLDLVQLHGDLPPRRAGDGGPYVWVVRGTPELEALRIPSPAPTWVLLDAAVVGFGGAGARTDWSWAARAVAHLAPLPVWLAGGITPQNAVSALATVGPAGLDVASGAELPGATRGEKDPARIAALVRACKT